MNVNSAALLEVEGLRFDFPTARVLHGVSFQLRAGRVTALVGPNGAGKTTLLRCLAALETPGSGSIRLAGIDALEQPRVAHRMIGYLPDHFGLYENLSVRRCLQYAGHAHGLSQATVETRVGEVTAALEIADKLDARAGSLSRGQRQRVALAQSILHRPKLLLLDEPASGLDPEARATLAQLLRGLRDEGMCLLVSSHILAELESYCDDMLILQQGRLQSPHSATQQQAPVASWAPNQKWQTLHIGLADASSITSAARWLATRPDVREAVQTPATETAAGGISIQFCGDAAARAGLLAAMIGERIAVAEFAVEVRRLQDTYLETVRGLPGNR